MLRGLVPNHGVSLAPTTTHLRSKGSFIEVPRPRGSLKSNKTLRYNSLLIEGPLLFNCLPMHLRDFKGSLDSFKKGLDKFLAQVPDQPNGWGPETPGAYTLVDGSPSNSIRDWVRVLHLSDWAPPHEAGTGCTFIPLGNQ